MVLIGALVGAGLTDQPTEVTSFGAPPPSQSTDDFCAGASTGGTRFVDDDGHTFEPAIECLAATGITTGGPGGLPSDQYGPDLVVSRAQMASFIAREIDTANELESGGVGELAPYDGTNRFSDVTADNVHLEAINRLSAAGITSGGPGGRATDEFGPDLPVTRAQMATFINRGHELLTGAELASDTDYFADDGGSPHEVHINGIASEGIAVGDGDVTYGPDRSVTRGQMAAFLVRHLSVLEEAGLIGPLPEDTSASPNTSFSPFATGGEGATPSHTQDPEPGDGPTDGQEAGGEVVASGTYDTEGTEQPPDQDSCSLITAEEFAAAAGGAAQQQVLEAGDACGYTAGDDSLRLAVALIAADADAGWLGGDVPAEQLEVHGRPARWAARYPVEESSVLVVELEGHDLVIELSSRGNRHADSQLRQHAVDLAGPAIERYQP